jgi:hypothetical protein
MPRFRVLVAALVLIATPLAAAAQPVEVTSLAAPDAFSVGARDTGLPATLWRGASLDTVQTVLGLVATKPLSPAAAALARRVLVTGAPGPQGAGDDPDLAAARAQALIALGEVKAAARVLERAAGLDRSAGLSRAAAESALLAGDDARACQVEEALTVSRDEVYWLRLRTYCQAIAGHADQAQLTFDLAQTQAKDAVFARLMGAKLAGAGNPGAASLRNGLDYALSRSLGLDLAAAKPGPGVAAAMSAAEPAEPAWTIPPGDDDITAATRSLAANQPLAPDLVDRLLDAAAKADAKSRSRAQTAALLVAAYAGPTGPAARGRIAALAVPEGKAPAGRDLALQTAARETAMGEAAVLALWTCAEAGPAGPGAGDRAEIIGALRAVGLDADARNFAVEGLLAAR